MQDHTDNSRASEPAFPAEEVHGDGIQQIKRHLGLTIREHIAVEAMKAIIASRETGDISYDDISHRAYRQADSMLAEPTRGVE